jgi:hypothetical protein
MQSWLSLGLGLVFAWLIVTFLIPARPVSYYALQPWPLELDDSNLALIGVGLASRAPAPSRPSVMDSTPAPPRKYVMVSAPSPGPAPMAPMLPPTPASAPAPVSAPSPVVMAPAPVSAPSPMAPMSPSPMASSPAPVTLSPSPSA